MLKKVSIVLIVFSLFIACSTNSKKGNLLVKGTVKGLRLGTLQIKQLKNDSLVSIDSIKIDGNENFTFHTDIHQPQVMVLELPEVKDGQILFFAAPHDTINIFAYVESFGINPIINGGTNQTQLNEFNKMIKQFNDKEMDLFKAKFDAGKQHLLEEADSLGRKLQNLQKKRQLYTLNFIFNNKDQAVAPYIALMQFYDNKKALDTIYKILPENIKQNKYAKEIKKILEQD